MASGGSRWHTVMCRTFQEECDGFDSWLRSHLKAFWCMWRHRVLVLVLLSSSSGFEALWVQCPHCLQNPDLYFQFLIALFWGNFGTYFWWLMNRQQTITCSNNISAYDNQVQCPSKELRGLSSCQDPHTHPLSVFDCQRTNEHVYRSLNAAC